MKIALCDDEYIQVKFIEEYLRQRNDDIDYYESGEALVCAYRDGGQRYDVVFLDIEMQPVSGFDTANILYAIDDSVLIVFVTSHHQHIEEWFKFPAMWFLHKPVTEAELDEVLSRITDKYASLRQAFTFTFTDSHQSVRLRCDEILYFEAQDHDIIIHKKGGDTQSFRLTMKELEEKLGKSFCRVHASYLVNLQYVTFIGRESKNSRQDIVKLAHCSQPLPVSRKYKPHLNDAFLNFKAKEFIG